MGKKTKLLTPSQLAAWKKKQENKDAISKAVAGLVPDAEGKVSLGEAMDAFGKVKAAMGGTKKVATVNDKGLTVKLATKKPPYTPGHLIMDDHFLTVDMEATEAHAISWLKNHKGLIDECPTKNPCKDVSINEVLGSDYHTSSSSSYNTGVFNISSVSTDMISLPQLSPADVITKAFSHSSHFGSKWRKAILSSATTYLLSGVETSDKVFTTKKFFDDHDLIGEVISQLAAEVILDAAKDQISGELLCAKAIIGHAQAHLKGDDISLCIHFSPEYDGDKDIMEKSVNDAIKLLKTASHTKWDEDDAEVCRMLDHAAEHLEGKDISLNIRFTLAFFGLDETFKPLPIIQIGMLGREDGPLSIIENRLSKVILVDGKLVDDPNVKMLKCCDGEGAHEYFDDEKPGCSCFIGECGCIIDEETIHGCSNCGACEDCCSTCADCDDCKDRVDKDIICDACGLCSKCCASKGNCWMCEGCNSKYSADDQCSCDYCSHCSECCECAYCEGHSCHHKPGTDICEGCNSCMKKCTCTDCKSCSIESENLAEGIGYCSSCHHCDDCGCICAELAHRLKYGKSMPFTPSYVPKTQKAKGFDALRRHAGTYCVPPFTLQAAKGSKPETLKGRFVRPCPMTPRHGFVDSRMVLDVEDGKKLIEETLKADPQAEFIVMSKIDAKWSGIWTPGKIIIGPGNDGATAGHGSIAINVAGDMFQGRDDMLALAGIKDSVYAEMLWEPHPGAVRNQPPTHYFVQLRDGPKLPETIDHIPNEMVIKNIILAEGDLLEWETKMKNQPEGTVVHHPGGSLASHYAVHAVLNGIPVLISRFPEIGETLAPTQDGEIKPDIEAIRRGFHYGMTVETDYNSATFLMLLGVHSTAQWLGKYDVLLGASLGLAYRLTITAAVGEWRHRPTRKKAKLSREVVYSRIFDRVVGRKVLAKIRPMGEIKEHTTAPIHGLYMRTLKDFRQIVWPEGMGGDQWFQFTQWGAVILNNVLDGNVNAALAAMNNAVHASHNNGWGFNKFAEGGAMDRVAKAPVYAARFCAPLMYRIMTRSEEHTKAADMWLAKAKMLPIGLSKDWITQVPVTPINAEFAQVKVVNPTTLEIQYRLARNSRCYSKELLVVDEARTKRITSLLSQTRADGRLMVTFEPNADGTHTDEDVLKNEDPSRQFIRLSRANIKEWALTCPNTLELIPITAVPLGPPAPEGSQPTEHGTTIPQPYNSPGNAECGDNETGGTL
jgi:hypothetical protein